MFGSLFDALEPLPEKYKSPELKARKDDTKHKCDCGKYLGDQEYAQLLIGQTLKCHRCHSPIWLDDTFFITHPTYVRIFFAWGKKWYVMNSWYLAYYYTYAKENPDGLHPEQLSRA